MDIEEILKEFEEKFEASITSSPGNIEHARAVIFFEDVVKIKDFLITHLTASYRKGREEALREILKKLPELYYSAPYPNASNGWQKEIDADEGTANKSLDEVKSIIQASLKDEGK